MSSKHIHIHVGKTKDLSTGKWRVEYVENDTKKEKPFDTEADARSFFTSCKRNSRCEGAWLYSASGKSIEVYVLGD